MQMGKCRLCEKQAELQLSHILPSFAFRWLRESGGGSALRNTREPNQRTQDGHKEYLLCRDCEEVFSRYERTFANKLLHPYLKDAGRRYHYGPWLLHFCVSISWRVLHYCMDKSVAADWEPSKLKYAQEVEATWREFLMGHRRHPGRFRQYVLPMDIVAETNGRLPPNFNRYIARSIDSDLCESPSFSFVYSKLGRFIILGFITEPTTKHWVGGKVHATEGAIEPRRYILPSSFGDYLMTRARVADDALSSVTDRQYQKIQDSLLANADRFARSDSFSAMEADIRLFGDAAFTIRKPIEK
jgi:hypothetical protein